MLSDNVLWFGGSQETLRKISSLGPKFLVQIPVIPLDCELIEGRDHILAIFVSPGYST